MTTQKELFASLKGRSTSTSAEGEREPLPPFIKYVMQGDTIQGVVVDTYVTTAWNPKEKAPQKDKNGDEVPQLNITLKLTHNGGKVKDENGGERPALAGETVRQSFSNDLLWKLNDSLQELGLDEVPVGLIIASRWEGMFVNSKGETTRAREHKVITKVAE